MIEYAESKITLELMREIEPMLADHYAEVEYLGERYRPKFGIYLKAAELGMFRIFTARDDGELVGYAGYSVSGHAHCEVVRADMQLVYVRPESRGIGMRLMEYAEGELGKHGVKYVYQSVPDKVDYGIILKRLGYRKVESLYVREVEG